MHDYSDWQPIEDLPANWQEIANDEVEALARVWKEQSARLQQSKAYEEFLKRMRRKIAIETGILERLYTIDRGTTLLLIQEGIDLSLIAHDATDRSAVEVVEILRDHEEALERVFDFVGGQRSLSTSFIKQLHQLLTRHQPYTEGVDQFGKYDRFEFVRGDWKKFPNNPSRPDGTVHYYAPPEQVAPQMEQLIEWHLQHESMGISPEVEAAWLHHRFTQIHPFQDGNGRVARCLASLVFIRAGWFPLVVTRDDQKTYIQALEESDQGNLIPLTEFFARAQKQEFITSLSLSGQVLSDRATAQDAIEAIRERYKQKQTVKTEEARAKAEKFAQDLHDVALNRLQEVAQDIRATLYDLVKQAHVSNALSNQPNADYYRFQIVQTARALDYYANLRDYKSWVRMAIITDDTNTGILFSFHVIGSEHIGLMVCSACGYRRLPSDDETSTVVDVQPLSQTPFQFSYADDYEKLEQRFRDWLESAIVVGLEYWRKGIGL